MQRRGRQRHLATGVLALLLTLLVSACSTTPSRPPTPTAAAPSPAATPTSVPSVTILAAESRQMPAHSTIRGVPPNVTPIVQPATGFIQVGTWRYMITTTYRTPAAPTSREHDGMPVAAKGIWQVVHLRLENNSELAQTLVKEDFFLRDDAGNHYPVDVATAGYSFANFLYQPGDNIEAGTAGETALLFDIDPAAKGLKLYLGGGAVAVELAS